MCYPPYPGPIVLEEQDKVPYLFVLQELAGIGRESAARVVRQLVQEVRAWGQGRDAAAHATTAEEVRETVEAVPELGATLPALHRLLRGAPDEAALEAAGLALMHLATWAEKVAAYRTALALYQAAEEADSDNPHYAYHVGRMARKLALYDAAEAWLKWANWIARARRRWEVAALCTSGLGNLHRQRGNLPLATRYHELTRRIARRHNLRTLEGDALYDLAGMSFDFGDMPRGTEYTRRAIEAYGSGHSRIYTLARDIAWMWMDRLGEFENAAHVLSALLEHIWEPPERLLLLSSLTRAAAGAGWREVFENMWNETWALMRQQPSRERHAASLTQLALAAGNFGYWERARIAADEALHVAEERKEGEMIFLAETILETVRSNVIAEDRMRQVFRDRQHMLDGGKDEHAASLASELANAMWARRDGAPLGPAGALTYAG